MKGERLNMNRKNSTSENILAILYLVLGLAFLKQFGKASGLQNVVLQRQS